MSALYIGLMSGTSVDGIDVALVDLALPCPQLIAFECLAFSDALKQEIQRLSLPDTSLTLLEYGTLDCQLGQVFAKAVHHVLTQQQLSAQEIVAIGSHGQTIYHHPNAAYPFSLQLGDPNVIAQHTGITTVADFRRRDIAAGGQGAPLVPAFHQAIFAQSTDKTCVLNIGGIANLSVLYQQPLIAFDTGVGNTLMDYWIQKHLHLPYDKHGDWARSGKVLPELLSRLKAADYFSAPPPKSTGKEYFSPAWLEQHLQTLPAYLPEDVQTTLCHFTAETIQDAMAHYAPETEQLLICGGGFKNSYLIELLKRADYAIHSTEKYGICPDAMEAMAFAWLAKQTLAQQTGNVCSVTGAHAPVILGGIYLA